MANFSAASLRRDLERVDPILSLTDSDEDEFIVRLLCLNVCFARQDLLEDYREIAKEAETSLEEFAERKRKLREHIDAYATSLKRYDAITASSAWMKFGPITPVVPGVMDEELAEMTTCKRKLAKSVRAERCARATSQPFGASHTNGNSTDMMEENTTLNSLAAPQEEEERAFAEALLKVERLACRLKPQGNARLAELDALRNAMMYNIQHLKVIIRMRATILGGLAFLAPMLSRLLTSSIFIVGACGVFAVIVEKAEPKDLFGATAAYAAVLVVFVGTVGNDNPAVDNPENLNNGAIGGIVAGVTVAIVGTIWISELLRLLVARLTLRRVARATSKSTGGRAAWRASEEAQSRDVELENMNNPRAGSAHETV